MTTLAGQPGGVAGAVDGGVVATFAGKIGEPGSDDGVGTAARFTRPNGIAIDASDTPPAGAERGDRSASR